MHYTPRNNNQAVKRLRMGEHCNDWVTCFQAVRTKLSHASYEQQRHKEVKLGVLKANNFLVKLKTER